MKTEELTQKITPVITIDKRLNQYSNKVLFPEKVKKAEEILRKCPPSESLFK